jgi:two-component system, OmpR family, phosphate regulon sensor histidine kinase PhoR
VLFRSRQKRGGPAFGEAYLEEAFNASWSLVEAKASSRQLRQFKSLPPAMKVKIDAASLTRIFNNLLDNAVKYSPPGGEVRVQAEAAAGFIKVWVMDQGAGIPREELPRLFERFYRVDKARSRELGGTGLGLSIVKHLVESVGGQVGVESQPGQGSIFWFTLLLA